MISIKKQLIQNEYFTRVQDILQEIRSKHIYFCCSEIDLFIKKSRILLPQPTDYYESVLKDLRKHPLEYVKHIYTELFKKKLIRGNFLANFAETWSIKLVRIK